MKPSKPKPITAERIERALDKLAWALTVLPRDEAGRAACLWKFLEDELQKKREEEAIIAAARDRLTRSRNQTGARSG